MKKIISLLMSVALALSCVVSVIAAVPEDTSEVTQDSKEGNTDTDNPTTSEAPKDTEEGEEETRNPLLSAEYELTYDSNLDSDYDIDGELYTPAFADSDST